MIRIRKTAICGTDMHICNWDDWAQKTIPVPMHVGHEYVRRDRRDGAARCAASASATASRARATSPAASAAIAAPAAGTCAATRSASASIARARSPSSSSSRHSTRSRSPTTSPTISRRSSIPSATRRTRRCRFSLVGEDVLITGAGPIGIMASAIARHVGARHVVVTDVNDYRLGPRAPHGRDARDQRRPREARAT